MYGSISAPIRNSPRSVWEMYTCICDETMITSRKGFSGSVTNACRMCVVIGSDTPARLATRVDQPAVALITIPASTSPRVVCTPVTRPFDRSMPVTSV